jgi:hypothetical protein
VDALVRGMIGYDGANTLVWLRQEWVDVGSAGRAGGETPYAGGIDTADRSSGRYVAVRYPNGVGTGGGWPAGAGSEALIISESQRA